MDQEIHPLSQEAPSCGNGRAEIRAFLAHLAVDLHVSASTQTVALSVLLFLYRDVLKQQLPYVPDIERAKPSKRLPVVFSSAEVQSVLAYLTGTNHLIASLLYGAGLRLMEGIRLRVKDIDFSANQLTIREGKGTHDLHTCLESGRPRREKSAGWVAFGCRMNGSVSDFSLFSSLFVK